MGRNCGGFLGVFLLVLPVSAANWPNWRGPDNSGHTDEKDIPLKWGAKENVRWRIDLPDAGNSTPVIWGDKVFITQARDKKVWPPKGGNGGEGSAETRMLLCLNRADGKTLWETKVTYTELEATHPTNPYCSASPVTDGERVIVCHGSAGLFCYDMDGKELWKKDLGKMEHVWGNAASPILHADLCIIWVGPGKNQALVAFDKKTGAEKWRHDEAGGASGLGNDKEWRGSWSTPLIRKVGNREELLLSVPEKMKAFDPKTGKELWSCGGLGKLVYTSPVFGKDDIVVAMAGYGGASLAVKAGGEGDVSEKNRLWNNKTKNPQRIGSGVIVGDHLFILNDTGNVQCLEVKTGTEVWTQRLGSTWSNMIASGDRLYVTTKNSETYVFKAGLKYEELAVNKLSGETMYASLAISNGDIFIRTHKALWCISEKK